MEIWCSITLCKKIIWKAESLNGHASRLQKSKIQHANLHMFIRNYISKVA